MRRTLLGIAVAAAAALWGCKSPEEQLVELKHDRQAALDQLYREYGGGALAGGVKAATDKAAAEAPDAGEAAAIAVDLLKTLGQVAANLDRDAFDAQCLAVGNAERPTILNPKAQAFFGRDEVQTRCRKLAVLDARIARLARESAKP